MREFRAVLTHASAIARFQALVRLFFGRFFEGMLPGASPNAGSFFHLLAFLAAPGLIVPILIGLGSSPNLAGPAGWGWNMVATYHGADALRSVSLVDKHLYLLCSMVAVGVISVMTWNALLLDHRDRLILGALPVRITTVVFAKLVALAAFVAIIATAMHVLASGSFGLMLAAGSSVSFLARGVVAHFVASFAASVFVLFAVTCVQGVACLLAGSRRFADVSSALQIAVAALVLAPLCFASNLNAGLATLQQASRTPESAWVFVPSFWFLGVYETVLGTSSATWHALAVTGWQALTVAIALTFTTHAVVSARLMRSSAGSGPGRERASGFPTRIAVLFSGDSEIRAVSEFFLATVLRLESHRLVLATSIGAGFAWSASGWIALLERVPSVPTAALLALPFSLLLFVVLGLRIAMAVPADLRAAWISEFFVIDAATVRKACTRIVMMAGVAPISVTFGLLAWRWWGASVALLHTSVLAATGWILVQTLLWRLRDIPCTRDWQPGRVRLRTRWPLYLLAVTTVTNGLPFVEWHLLDHPVGSVLFVACLVTLGNVIRTIARSRHAQRRDDTDVRIESFDGLGYAISGAPRDYLLTSHEVSSRAHASSQVRLFERFHPKGWRAELSGLEPRALVRLVHDGAARDFRFALRRLRRAPAFTAFSVATLASGIGATTTFYSLTEALTSRPMQIHDAARVLSIRAADRRADASLSWFDFQDLRNVQASFSALEAESSFLTSLGRDGPTRVVEGRIVSGGYFEMLGVEPAFGRLLRPADDQPGAPPAVVLSESTWRTMFGSDQTVIGTQVRVGGLVATVVGILPASFRGVHVRGAVPALWTPIAHPPMTTQALTTYRDSSRRDRPYLRAFGRLKPDVSADVARAEVRSIASSLDAVAPLRTIVGNDGGRRWTVAPITDDPLELNRSVLAFALLLLPVIVLLVACTNLSNLVLSRGSARRNELRIRRALGASRWSLIREHVIEYGLVAVAGGLCGVTIAWAGVSYVAAFVQRVAGYGPEYQIDARVDVSVLIAALAAASVAVLISGVLPALHLTGEEAGGLSPTNAASSTLRWRGRANLIALQVAASLVLLLVAAICVRAIVAANQGGQLQADLAPVGAIKVALNLRTHDPVEAARLTGAILDATSRRGGVTATAAVTAVPGSAPGQTATTTPGRPFDPDTRRASVIAGTPEIFRVLGLRLTSGLPFDDSHTSGAPRVAVISLAVARDLFGQADAVGHEVIIRSSVADGTGVETLTVVGVADNAGVDTDGQPLRHIYLSYAQRSADDPRVPAPDLIVVARSASGQAGVAVAALRASATSVDPELAVTFEGPAARLASQSFAGLLLLIGQASGILALAALVLSMAGLYGVVSHVVAGRVKELGIRLALGASRRQILTLVFADGARPVLRGIIGGLIVAVIVRQGLQPFFAIRIAALDWLVMALSALPLVVAATIACYLPARRAAGVDPQRALKDI